MTSGNAIDEAIGRHLEGSLEERGRLCAVPSVSAQGTAMRECAELRGGLLGKAELVRCRSYRSPEEFLRDLSLHWNPPEWYEPPVMHGFEFAHAQRIDFEAVRGDLYFFEVDKEHAP